MPASKIGASRAAALEERAVLGRARAPDPHRDAGSRRRLGQLVGRLDLRAARDRHLPIEREVLGRPPVEDLLDDRRPCRGRNGWSSRRRGGRSRASSTISVTPACQRSRRAGEVRNSQARAGGAGQRRTRPRRSRLRLDDTTRVRACSAARRHRGRRPRRSTSPRCSYSSRCSTRPSAAGSSMPAAARQSSV